MPSGFLWQVIDRDTGAVAQFPPGSPIEVDVIDACIAATVKRLEGQIIPAATEATVKRGVGFFTSEARVRLAMAAGFHEVISETVVRRAMVEAFTEILSQLRQRTKPIA